MSLCVRKGINAFQWAGNVTIHRTVPIIPMKKIAVSKSFISKSREGTANRKFNALWRCEWVWGKSNLRLSYIYIIIFRRFVYHRLKLCKFYSYTHTNSLSFSDEKSVFFCFGQYGLILLIMYVCKTVFLHSFSKLFVKWTNKWVKLVLGSSSSTEN